MKVQEQLKRDKYATTEENIEKEKDKYNTKTLHDIKPTTSTIRSSESLQMSDIQSNKI